MITKTFAAGICNPVLQGTLGCGDNNVAVSNVGNIISALVGLFLIVALIATLLYMVLGGLAWVTSDGDKAKLEQARSKITNAVLGLIIVAASWAIWILIGNFFGLNLQSINLPTFGG